MTETEPRLLTVEETMSLLRISKPTLYRLVSTGQLIATRIGGRTLFDLKDLNDFVERSKAPENRSGRGRKPAGKE
jgi:excisionase family DNA binding protein